MGHLPAACLGHRAIPAGRQALRALREAMWGEEIAKLIGQPARAAFGPFAVDGTTKWRAGDLPRLYVVVEGYATFNRGKKSGLHRGRPNEVTVIDAARPVAILIVELETER